MDTLTPQPASTTPAPHPQSPAHWRHTARQYGRALHGAAIPLFAFFSLYIFYRRGYYNLYIVNKVVANEAAVLLGIVLLLGPLSRYFSFPDRYLQYRKELGIIAFFSAAAHVVISLFFLPKIFPFAAYMSTIYWPFVLGVSGITALTALFFISNERAANAIGRQLWWHMQNWGVRIVFTLVFLHVYVMKWAAWLKWYKIGGEKALVHPNLPGAGLLVGIFMAFVVLMRLSEFAGARFFRVAWYICAIALPAIYIATFAWGMQFAK